jgi:hypothetical protein
VKPLIGSAITGGAGDSTAAFLTSTSAGVLAGSTCAVDIAAELLEGADDPLVGCALVIGEAETGEVLADCASGSRVTVEMAGAGVADTLDAADFGAGSTAGVVVDPDLPCAPLEAPEPGVAGGNALIGSAITGGAGMGAGAGLGVAVEADEDADGAGIGGS